MGRIVSEKVLAYHDYRWCKPCFNDVELFGFLVLEIMQAGLNWATVLEKEFFIKQAFDNFDFKLIANYDLGKIIMLRNDSKIIRNSRKINAVIENARIFSRIQASCGSFLDYIWSFSSNKVVDHKLTIADTMPIKNELSDKVSCCLKKQGFKFVGSIIIYSYLQAIGVINDHVITCKFR